MSLNPETISSEHLPNPPGKNPACVNVETVKTALHGILPLVPPIREFTIISPVTITLHTGENIDSHLTYHGAFASEHTVSPYRVELGIYHEKYLLSERSWRLDYPYDHKRVDAFSSSSTDKHWEHNHFAKALIYRNDDVMYHVLSHLAPFWGENIYINAFIYDLASGETHPRDNWSTDMALALGFTQTDVIDFEKIYTRRDRV